MLDKIECNNIIPSKTSRLRKIRHEPNSSSRPILLVLSSVTDKQNILNQSKRLKDAGDEFKSIYLKKDLHPDVRKEWKRLRDSARNEKSKPENHGMNIFVDYTNGVLRRNGDVIDRFVNPFRIPLQTNST